MVNFEYKTRKLKSGIWNNRAPLLTCVIVLNFALQLRAQDPEIKWWFDTYDASFGQTAAADIDHDGFLELVFGCYRNDSSVYALNAEDGSLLWKYNTASPGVEGCNDVAPVIFDVDDDDTLEVIVPASCNPTTFCFNGHTGKVKWQRATRGSDSPPTITDLDNDGKPEILHGEFGGYVICLNGENGTVAWEIDVDLNSWIQTAPNADSSLFWHYSIPEYGTAFRGAALADINGDDYPDVIFGTSEGRFIALNGFSDNVIFNTDLSAHYGKAFDIDHAPVVADFDQDGELDAFIIGGHAEYPNFQNNYGRGYALSLGPGRTLKEIQIDVASNQGSIPWNGTDAFGQKLAPGVYLAVLQGNNGKAGLKIVAQ